MSETVFNKFTLWESDNPQRGQVIAIQTYYDELVGTVRRSRKFGENYGEWHPYDQTAATAAALNSKSDSIQPSVNLAGNNGR